LRVDSVAIFWGGHGFCSLLAVGAFAQPCLFVRLSEDAGKEKLYVRQRSRGAEDA